MLTKEWPPAIYGGAGVHVVNLVSALRERNDIRVDVHCFGESRSDALAYQVPDSSINPALSALITDAMMANAISGIDLVHSHTWYTNMAGHWTKVMQGVPHVVTAHSLEPRRPWKAEQLGGGYQLSSWAESTAYHAADAIIAVSDGMRSDVLEAYPNLDPSKVHTIRNGVDTEKFLPNFDSQLIEPLLTSVNGSIPLDAPFAIFVGRITRQKGVAHLLRAWRDVDPSLGLVLAAGAADEPGIGKEIADLVQELQQSRKNIVWIKEMLPHQELTALLTHARMFICPSIYEPLGIVNLEAMACGTAVVASAVGGIPEVVSHGGTGELVSYSDTDSEFESGLAQAINRVGLNADLAQKYGAAGRERARLEFDWESVAKATLALYQSLQ